MSKAIDDIFQEGIEKGIDRGQKKGEETLGRLISALLTDGRIDDVKKAASSARVRKRLYKEYGIAG